MSSSKPQKIFIFLDTEKHASPFDILTTIDLFPDATILKYENVTPEDAKTIIQDAMFPRGPEGAEHTKIFVNGRDPKSVNHVLNEIKRSMFKPFELSVIIDPRGAYTTASAAVAKTLALLNSKSISKKSSGVKVTILAGTGAVGRTAATLFSLEKHEIVITSRSPERALSVATEINEQTKDKRVQGIKAETSEETGRAIEDAEIIISAGAAGTRLLPLDILRTHGKKCKIVADINAIPPLGVEALEPEADGKEISNIPNVVGIGALAIGKFKNNVEAELIKTAAEQPNGIFGYETAYEIAKKIAKKTLIKKEQKEEVISKYWLP